MKKKLIALCAAALALSSALPAAAQQDAANDAQQLRASLLILVRTLLDQNVLTVPKAQEMLRQAGIDPALLQAPSPAIAAAPAPAASAPPVVRVPYVPEAVKRELRDEIRQEVIATARAERWAVPESLPAWLSRISFNGDIRLRLQRDGFADDNGLPASLDSFYQLLNASGQPTTVNTSEARSRLRVRARFGVAARVSDDVQAGLRIVTSKGGDANDPASENVDAGQGERRFGIALDQAYIGWSLGPYSVSGGRIANPYQTTDLLWSNDLTLDGAAASWKPNLGYEWNAFATVGAHPLHEVNNSLINRANDSWLIGAQAGVAWKPGTGWNARGGIGLFDFKNIEARLNPPGAGDGSTTDYNDAAPLVRTRGNTMFNISAQSNPAGGATWGIASKFRVLDLNGGVEYMTPEQWRFGVQGDYLNNIGYDRDEILSRIGAAASQLPADSSCAAGVGRLSCRRTKGYRLEFTAGHGLVDDAGSWSVSFGTRHLERDAVPDGFTTGDYRLGGTDVKASFFGGSYSVARNTQLSLRYIDAQSIDSPVPFRVNTWLVDLLAHF